MQGYQRGRNDISTSWNIFYKIFKIFMILGWQFMILWWHIEQNHQSFWGESLASRLFHIMKMGL